MATAYVSPTGSATYPGTVGAPTSLTTALSSAGAGDIVYLAPGNYRGTFTLGVSGTAGNTIQFIGDPTASQAIGGISAGIVRITNYLNDNVNPTSAILFTASNRNYWSFANIYFETYNAVSTYAYSLATCTNWAFEKCVFISILSRGFTITTTANVSLNASFTRCSFITGSYAMDLNCPNHTSPYSLALSISKCVSVTSFIQSFTGSAGNNTNAGGITVYNCYVKGPICFQLYQANTTHPTYIYNSVLNAGTGIAMLAGTNGSVIENYNRVVGSIAAITQGANSSYAGSIGIDYGYSAINGISAPAIDGPYFGSRLLSAGTTVGAPTTDVDDATWYQSLVDIGAYTFTGRNNIITFPATVPPNSITIFPGSTSQSIEINLGITGLTYNTSGLKAYYNRTRSSPVQINLVARTITQSWISGGFAEVDPANMPGIYRLDIPNEALASGASDVTLTVRGASGTNGAVLTIKLNAAPLTETQTATAVWNADRNQYNNPDTFGARVVQTTEDNRDVIVTAGNQIQIDNEQTFYPTVGQDLDAITEDVGRWTLRNNVLTLYGPDGTYIRRIRLSTLGITL